MDAFGQNIRLNAFILNAFSSPGFLPSAQRRFPWQTGSHRTGRTGLTFGRNRSVWGSVIVIVMVEAMSMQVSFSHGHSS